MEDSPFRRKFCVYGDVAGIGVYEAFVLVVVVLGAEIAAVEVAPGGLDLVVADVGAGARGGAGGGEGEPGLQRRRRGRD